MDAESFSFRNFVTVLIRYASRFSLDMGEGDADKILIWNKGLHSYYVRHGASPELMEVTGHPVDDRIGNFMAHQHENRNHLVQRHQLDGSNKIVIFNYPPSHHTSQDPKRNYLGFSSLHELCQTIFALLSSMQQIEVIISLHPRADADVVRKLTEQFNFKIDDMPVEELLPCADLLVSDFSTVIFIATSCGLPVLCFNAYDFPYDAFDECIAEKKPFVIC